MSRITDVVRLSGDEYDRLMDERERHVIDAACQLIADDAYCITFQSARPGGDAGRHFGGKSVSRACQFRDQVCTRSNQFDTLFEKSDACGALLRACSGVRVTGGGGSDSGGDETSGGEVVAQAASSDSIRQQAADLIGLGIDALPFGFKVSACGVCRSAQGLLAFAGRALGCSQCSLLGQQTLGPARLPRLADVVPASEVGGDRQQDGQAGGDGKAGRHQAGEEGDHADLSAGGR